MQTGSFTVAHPLRCAACPPIDNALPSGGPVEGTVQGTLVAEAEKKDIEVKIEKDADTIAPDLATTDVEVKTEPGIDANERTLVCDTLAPPLEVAPPPPSGLPPPGLPPPGLPVPDVPLVDLPPVMSPPVDLPPVVVKAEAAEDAPEAAHPPRSPSCIRDARLCRNGCGRRCEPSDDTNPGCCVRCEPQTALGFRQNRRTHTCQCSAFQVAFRASAYTFPSPTRCRTRSPPMARGGERSDVRPSSPPPRPKPSAHVIGAPVGPARQVYDARSDSRGKRTRNAKAGEGVSPFAALSLPPRAGPFWHQAPAQADTGGTPARAPPPQPLPSARVEEGRHRVSLVARDDVPPDTTPRLARGGRPSQSASHSSGWEAKPNWTNWDDYRPRAAQPSDDGAWSSYRSSANPAPPRGRLAGGTGRLSGSPGEASASSPLIKAPPVSLTLPTSSTPSDPLERCRQRHGGCVHGIWGKWGPCGWDCLKPRDHHGPCDCLWHWDRGTQTRPPLQAPPTKKPPPSTPPATSLASPAKSSGFRAGSTANHAAPSRSSRRARSRSRARAPPGTVLLPPTSLHSAVPIDTTKARPWHDAPDVHGAWDQGAVAEVCPDNVTQVPYVIAVGAFPGSTSAAWPTTESPWSAQEQDWFRDCFPGGVKQDGGWTRLVQEVNATLHDVGDGYLPWHSYTTVKTWNNRANGVNLPLWRNSEGDPVPGTTYGNPFVGYVGDNSEWWHHYDAFMTRVVPALGVSQRLNISLAGYTLRPGNCFAVGASPDGTEGRGPRQPPAGQGPTTRFAVDRPEGRRSPSQQRAHLAAAGTLEHAGSVRGPRRAPKFTPCINLDTGGPGGTPIDASTIRHAYIGVSINNLVSILETGLRNTLHLGDIVRLLSEGYVLAKRTTPRLDGLPSGVMASLDKNCAAGYPGTLYKGLQKRGTLVSADGSGPQWVVLQLGWVSKDPHTGKSTLLWSRDAGANSQIFVDAFYLVIRWIHVYGATEAYRPFRATGFSESCCFSLRHWIQWTNHEYLRRRRRAEVLFMPSDVDASPPEPVRRLAPRRVVPRFGSETTEEATQRELDKRGGTTEGFGSDSDGDVCLPPKSPLDRETKRKTLGEWWNNSIYARKRQRHIDRLRPGDEPPAPNPAEPTLVKAETQRCLNEATRPREPGDQAGRWMHAGTPWTGPRGIAAEADTGGSGASGSSDVGPSARTPPPTTDDAPSHASLAPPAPSSSPSMSPPPLPTGERPLRQCSSAGCTRTAADHYAPALGIGSVCCKACRSERPRLLPLQALRDPGCD